MRTIKSALRRALIIPSLAAVHLLVAPVSATAADPETLRAATVKITVTHSQGVSPGSGIILCQRNGRVDILTAKHVVTGVGLVNDSGAPAGERFRDVTEIEVAFYRNDPLPVRFSPRSGEVAIRSAEYKDLALVTLAGVETRLQIAQLGSSAALGAGADVESVGHLDVDWDWARGSVRSVGEFIRHSLAIDRGYSGGPLYNRAGEVVGINLQKVRGVARAMPIEEAMLTVRRWIDPQCLGPPPPPPRVSAPTAGERKVERIAGVDFAWRYIPPGTFQMGSPTSEKGRISDETLHQVTLTRGFWMGETEVTQDQWQALMRNNPSGFKDCGLECPVEQVNWYEAIAFANALSGSSRLEECYVLSGDNGKKPGEGVEIETVQFRGLDCEGFRLPTEAEWEYAARAGTTTPFWTGKNLTTDQANYNGNYTYAGHAKGQYRQRTVAARSFEANPWNLYQVHGNVWEWTKDAANWDSGQVVTDTYRDGVEDPLSTRGSRRVFRGGGWRNYAGDCRAAYRIASPPGYRSVSVGFRLVRTLR